MSSLNKEPPPKIQLRNLTLHLQDHMELEDLIMQMQHFVPSKIITVKNKTKIMLFDKDSIYPIGLIPERISSTDIYNFKSKNGDQYSVCGEKTSMGFFKQCQKKYGNINTRECN